MSGLVDAAAAELLSAAREVLTKYVNRDGTLRDHTVLVITVIAAARVIQDDLVEVLIRTSTQVGVDASPEEFASKMQAAFDAATEQERRTPCRSGRGRRSRFTANW